VDASTSSGNTRGSTPATSRMRSALGNIEPTCAPSQRAEIGERGNHYIYRLQTALAVQLAVPLMKKWEYFHPGAAQVNAEAGIKGAAD